MIGPIVANDSDPDVIALIVASYRIRRLEIRTVVTSPAFDTNACEKNLD